MGRKANITIDCRMIAHSGIGRYLENLLPAIVAEFRNLVLLGSESQLKGFSSGRGDVDIVEFNAPIYSIKEQIKFWNVIPNCNLFWSPHYNVPLLPVKAKNKIVTIHDVFHLAYSNDLSVMKRYYSRLVMEHAVNHSSEIITVSNFSKSEIIKYLPSTGKSEICVIHNGVNEIGSSKNQKAPLLNYFLYVGNVKPHKNLTNAILGYLDFLKQNGNPPTKFVIVGKKDGFITSDVKDLSTLIDANEILKEHIIFTGYIDDNELRLYYESAISLIFPSNYEGFGLPPLEAMKLKCPVIVSNTSSLPEVCGDAALYVNPANIGDISGGMTKMFKNDDNLRSDLIVRGLKQSSKFAWSASAHAHIELFKRHI